MTKAEQLRQLRLEYRKAMADDYGNLSEETAREYASWIAEIDRELERLARRRAYSREHRQVLYDLNGHHGPA